MTDWNTSFPAVILRRYDLKQTGLSDAQIAALTDEDMQEIAREWDCFIEDYSFDTKIWEHLRKLADSKLSRRNSENHPA